MRLPEAIAGSGRCDYRVLTGVVDRIEVLQHNVEG
jgi:hypothetical protein